MKQANLDNIGKMIGKKVETLRSNTLATVFPSSKKTRKDLKLA